MQQEIENKKDNIRFGARILQRIETRLSDFIESYQFAVDRSAEWKSVFERTEHLRKFSGKIIPVSREQAHAALVSNRLSTIAIELKLADPAGAIGQSVNRKTLHRRREWNVVTAIWSHPEWAGGGGHQVPP